MSLKLFGSFLLTNSYQNVRYCTCNLSFNFNRCNCLKSRSVWALHYPIIIRRARFCNFDMWFPSNPQFVIPNLGCKRINESFINFMAESIVLTYSLCPVCMKCYCCLCEFQFTTGPFPSGATRELEPCVKGQARSSGLQVVATQAGTEVYGSKFQSSGLESRGCSAPDQLLSTPL